MLHVRARPVEDHVELEHLAQEARHVLRVRGRQREHEHDVVLAQVPEMQERSLSSVIMEPDMGSMNGGCGVLGCTYRVAGLMVTLSSALLHTPIMIACRWRNVAAAASTKRTAGPPCSATSTG